MRGRFNTQKRLLWLRKQYRHEPEVFIRTASIIARLNTREVHGEDAGGDAFAHPQQLIYDLESVAGKGWGACDLTLEDYALELESTIRNNHYHETRTVLERGPFDKYTAWVAKVVNSLVKANRAGTLKARGTRRPLHEEGAGYWSEEGEWVQDARFLPLIQRVRLLARSLPQIRDWAEAERVNLMGLTYQQAKRRSNLWHRELEKQELAEGAEPGELVFRFADGWTVQHLTKRAHLKQEGKALKHCVGATPVYWDAMQRGYSRILSLRDAQGVPQVTMEFQPPGALRSGRHGAYRVESPEDTPFPRWGLTQAKAFKNKRPPNQLADRIVYWLLRTVPEGKDLHAAGVDRPDLQKQSGWMVPNPGPGKAKVSLRHKALLLDRPPSPMIPHSGEPYPVEWIEILEEHYPWAQP